MKIDRTKLKKGSSEVPSDCKRLIERLKNCSDAELLSELRSIKAWNYGKSELCHWIDVLDLFDSILERGVRRERESQWSLPCDSDDDLKELMVHVIIFTSLLIEHSFSRNSYNSMEHLTTLLSSSDMQIVLAVLNLLYAFSKRSNFISRLNSNSKQVLIQRLNYLAESWGGKENGFGLAECCQDLPLSSYPSSATNLHFEFYTDEPTIIPGSCGGGGGGGGAACSSTQTGQSVNSKGSTVVSSPCTASGLPTSKHTATTLNTIHVDNVDQIKDKSLAQLMEELVNTYNVPKSKQMLLFTHLRLAHSFSNYRKRLQCVQARLQALSVIVYCNSIAIQENGNNILYNGFIEELVDVLEIKSNKLHDIKAAALRTLTSVIHLDHSSKLTTIIDVTGASSYHGFLPSLVRSCIQALIDGNIDSFPIPFATALFSFLYHLASYENGGEALVSCGMIESLLKVINWNGSDPEHITFVIRSVRVIDLITNLDMSAFQTHNGISIFINRLESEVEICKKEQPFVIDVPSANSLPEGDFFISDELAGSSGTSGPSTSSGSSTSAAAAAAAAAGSSQAAVTAAAAAHAAGPSSSSNSPMAADSVSNSATIPGQSSINNADSATVIAIDGSPMEVDASPKPSTSSTSSALAAGSSSCQVASSNIVSSFAMPAINKDLQCYPQRAALLKSMLNFLKKAIQDTSFSDQIRRLMDSSLPSSLRHIVSNAEYYGASLFILATDVITVYVFQEPSLLSTLQENGLTTVVLQAFLSKEIPATREVISTLPNVFSALCLNSRGLESFSSCQPFEKVFKVLISPEYLPAMRRRRSADPMGDTASNLGNAMDELMRHQPRLRQDATIAIVNLLNELCALGSNPNYVCSKSPVNKSLESAQGSSGVDGSAPGAGARTGPLPAGNDAGSSDEEEEEDDDATNGPTNNDAPNKDIATSTLASTCTGAPGQTNDEKQHVPLVDYILNVMRFVESILSNNSTDDHCREFVKHKGLNPLLRILLLPNLPVDFPANTACLAVASVCKSILTLAHEKEVLREGLKLLSDVLARLSQLHKPLEAPGGSVLLDEYLNALVQVQSMEAMSGHSVDPLNHASLTPLLHAMSAAHAMINMFVHVSRTGQSDTRNLCITHWGSELGINVLNQLSELYTSLVWESTVLLALCSDQAPNASWQFGRHQLDKLSTLIKDCPPASSSSSTGATGVYTDEANPAMEVDEPIPPINVQAAAAAAAAPSATASSSISVQSTSSPSSRKKDSKQGTKMSPQLKQIRPLLSSASRLGRALAELFGLLVKLSVGTPLRQRRSHHTIANVPLPPTPASRAISVSLTSLLARGLSWEPPATSPIPKFRLTFYICSVGFTSPMLFDERKCPYHLMLQNFVQYHGQKAFFDTFRWALTQAGKVAIEEGIEHPDLPEGTGEFLDTWLTLLEKLINPKNILESPHSLPPQPMINSSSSMSYPPFDPLRYLISIHKKAFECIMCLWNKKPIKTHGEKMSETVLTILCHLLKGESIINERLAKEKADADAANALAAAAASAAAAAAAAAASSGAITAASSSSVDGIGNANNDISIALDPSLSLNRVYIPGSRLAVRTGGAPVLQQQPQYNPDHLTQLMEMGFARELALEALIQTNSLEQATEYVLTHPPPAQIPGPPEMDVVEETPFSAARSGAGFPQQESSSSSSSSTNAPGESTGEGSSKSSCNVVDDEPLSKELMDDFTKDILPGCLRLLDTIPETVYRVCDLLNAVAARNGEEWICHMFKQLIDEIYLNINKLLAATDPLTSSDKRTISEWATQISSMPEALKAATRIHLFSLLFEDTNRRNRCAYLLQEVFLIDNLVLLLERAQNNMSVASGFGVTVSTPKWLAPVILLIDLYDKAAVASERRAPLLHMQRRQWKWFDDRAGKWTSYIANNNKTIDDAYKAGEPYIRFTPGRRKYTVHFNTMVQINEETNSWRPIMFVNDDKAMDVNEDSNSGTNDVTVAAAAAVNSRVGDFKVLKGLEANQKVSLIRSCVEFISASVEPESLHAVMRLCLRLTRSHEMATLFAEQGGVRAILQLTHNDAFSGFISLASLIIRHVLEESSMLRQTMEKVVRASLNHSHSTTLREMHYVLRGLGPAACRDKDIFIKVAKSSLRISLPPLTKREDEDARLVGANVSQQLKLIPSKPGQSTGQIASKTAKTLICDLLNSLTVKVPWLSPSEEVKELPGGALVTGLAPPPPPPPPPPPTQGSSTAVTPTGGPVVAISAAAAAGRNAAPVDPAQPRPRESDDIDEDSVEDAYKEFSTIDFKSKDEEAKKNRPLMSQSSLLRLLAELARSYSVVAKLITEHTYTVGQSELITEDCTALAFILDHLLPATQTTGDKDCPALARVLIAALSSCTHCVDAQSQLVSEVKASLNRALNLIESSEKHARIQAIAAVMNTMIESCPPFVAPSNHQMQPIRGSTALSNMNRLMLRKGLVNDLARVTHSLDLSSPQMALTVNSVLKPLETLSRVVNQIIPIQPLSKKFKSNTVSQEQMEESTNPAYVNLHAADGDAAVLMSQVSEPGSLTDASFRVDEILSSTRTDDHLTSSEPMGTTGQPVGSTDVALPSNAPPTEMSSVSDTHAYAADATVDDATDSEAAAGVFSDDNLTIGSAIRNAIYRVAASQDEEMRHEPNDDSVNIDDAVVNESHEATGVNGANAGADTESEGDSDSDEDDEEDDDDDEDDDDNSGAENEDEEEDEDDQADEVDDEEEEEALMDDALDPEGNLFRMIGAEDDFLFDIDDFIPANILRDGLSSLIPMLETEYPTSGGQSAETTQPSVPPAPNSVAVSHPLLNRQQEAASNILGGSSAAPASILATRGQRMPRSRISRYPRDSNFSAFNRHFPIHSRYTNQPLILQRLLGNSAPQDYLQIAAGSAPNPGRVIMSGNEFHIIATDDVTDLFELHDANSYMPHSSNTTLGAIPSALVRWTEESRVLDGDSIHDCIASIKPEIIGFLEEVRDKEIAERKERRRKLIEDEKKRADKKSHDSINVTFSENASANATDAAAAAAAAANLSEHNNQTITATSTVFTGSPEGGQTVVRVESDSTVNASTERLAASLVEQVLAPVVASAAAAASVGAPDAVSSANPSSSSSSHAAATTSDSSLSVLVSEPTCADTTASSAAPSSLNPSGHQSVVMIEESSPTSPNTEWMEVPGQSFPNEDSLSVNRRLDDMDMNSGGGSSNDEVNAAAPSTSSPREDDSEMMDFTIVPQEDSQQARTPPPSSLSASTDHAASSNAAQDDALLNIGMRRVSSDNNTFSPVADLLPPPDQGISNTPSQAASTEATPAASTTSAAAAATATAAATSIASTATTSSSVEQNLDSDIPEGVDPSFLAALPEQIRQEVLADQRRQRMQQQQQQQTPAATSSSSSTAAPSTSQPDLASSEISPEFLAALPPAIQEEVLAQQRFEREQHQPPNPDAPVDPANFFLTLAPALRRQVLADMDDSQIALLPPDLQAEAQALRSELEHRHRQIQERFFTSQANSTLSRILRSAGTQGGRVGNTHRYAIHALSTHPNGGPWPWNIPSARNTASSATGGSSNVVLSPSVASRGNAASRVAGRQLLDNEALSCLLILLFVDEPKLNVSRLHRVLRNLSHHASTRQWVIQSLLTIMERTRESREIDLTPRSKSSASSLQPGQKSISGHQVASWLSISLDAALGCKTNVFQIQRPFSSISASASGKRSSTSSAASSAGPLGHGVTIHPQAAPLVTRHVLDALISLAKSFPDQFLADSFLSPSKDEAAASKDAAAKQFNSSSAAKDTSEQASSAKLNKDADFWDVLVKLDSLSTSKKGKSVIKNHPSSCQWPGLASTSGDTDSPSCELISPLRSIINLLSHPVIRRSAPLTDRLLRLLSLISGALPHTVNAIQSASSQSSTEQSMAPSTATSTAGKETTKSTSCPSDTPSRPLVPEEQLRLAVEVLTSKSCSEEGLEDVNQLLLRLSESCPKTREIVLKLLLEGAQHLGQTVKSNIDQLYDELRALNIKTRDESAASAAAAAAAYASASSSQTSADDSDSSGKDKTTKGTLHDRFTHGQVVITAPTNFKPNVTSKEVQLPSMATLTSKTSSQSFFLRILKVIIQLKKSIRSQKKKESNRSSYSQSQQPPAQSQSSDQQTSSTASSSRSTHQPVGSQAQSDVQSAARDAAADQQPGHSDTETSRRNFNQTFEMDVDVSRCFHSTPVKGPDDVASEDAPLSVQLALEDLWNSLSRSLVELADAPDHHAVLVLQPAVEAFFLVHSCDKEPRRNSRESRQESAQNQLAHLNVDIQPSSPSSSDLTRDEGTSAASGPVASASGSSSSGGGASLPSDTHKFLQFAETHKLVLNQILRQSTTPLAEGPFAVLVDHTRVLDFDVKRRYFRQELERLDEGVRREDLVVHVRRDHVFEDSFRELYRRSPDEWKNRFYIVFEGEEGQDAGGLLREWYTIISREIFNPMYALFTTSPGDRVTYMINPASHCNSNHLQYFKFVGRVIAKAIYDNKLLECYFTRSFYKHILGKLVKYHDMESEDYSFYQGLVFLLEHDIKEIGYELTFSLEVQEFGVTEVRDLKPNGRNIVVTEEAKQEYVRLVCQEKMTGAIRKQLNAFLEGFYEIIPKRLISIFNEQETELLISGLPSIDIDDLKANTEYHKYQASSLQIQWFWRALRSFDQADRAKFLQFVTGTSKVPLQGFGSLEGMNGIQKFQIHRDDRSTDRLPSAHTCFNQLDLPAYETYDKLKRFLHLAILECNEGFGFA